MSNEEQYRVWCECLETCYVQIPKRLIGERVSKELAEAVIKGLVDKHHTAYMERM